MRTRVTIATLLLMGTLASIHTSSFAQTCPTVPSGKCCLTRVSLAGRGLRSTQATHGARYDCPSGSTARPATQIRVDLRSFQCNEERAFTGTLRLVASGSTIVRADGVAEFFGKFQLGTPGPLPSGFSQVLVTGCIELIDRVGTHHALTPAAAGCEPCNPTNHVEGWLMGDGVGPQKGGHLRASLSAVGKLNSNGSPSAFAPNLEGVWIVCP